MWQLGNGGVKSANLSFLIRILIFVISCHLLFTPALQAKGRKPNRKPHGKPPGNAEQALKSKIAKMKHSPRVTNGETTFSDSMCLILVEKEGDYYEWTDNGRGSNSGLVISDRCVLTRAYAYLNFSNNPATPNTADPTSYICYVPRDGCDTAYHFAQLVLSKTATMSSGFYQNNIAIFKDKPQCSNHHESDKPHCSFHHESDKPHRIPTYDVSFVVKRAIWLVRFVTQKKMEIGKSICGQYPLFPAAVSCDRNGPPDHYSDCFIVGWGKKNSSEVTPEAEIQPNRIRVTTLTPPECEAVRVSNNENAPYDFLNPSAQICVRTVDGNSGYCNYDYNFVLYCKYWGNTTGGWGEGSGGWSQSSGGWGEGSGGWGQGSEWWGGFQPGWQNPNNGWGWGKPSFEPQQILAVGQYFDNYGRDCTTVNSASLVLKFGYEGYSDLFGSCGMTCSDSLPEGDECMEKWDPALGPVYCTPQRIQHNHGWRAEHRRDPTHH